MPAGAGLIVALLLVLSACGGTTAVEQTDAGGGGVGAGGGGAGAGAGSGDGGAGGSGGAAVDYYSCSAPGECALTAKGCCPSCGEPNVGSFVGVKVELAATYHELMCIDSKGCGLCMPPPHPSFTAVCRQNECTVIDIRSDELSACASNEDCRLRWGALCCESCSGSESNLVAVGKLVDFDQAVCSATSACDSCVLPPYPADRVAVCSAGHCRVEPVGS